MTGDRQTEMLKFFGVTTIDELGWRVELRRHVGAVAGTAVAASRLAAEVAARREWAVTSAMKAWAVTNAESMWLQDRGVQVGLPYTA